MNVLDLVVSPEFVAAVPGLARRQDHVSDQRFSIKLAPVVVHLDRGAYQHGIAQEGGAVWIELRRPPAVPPAVVSFDVTLTAVPSMTM